MSGQSGHTPETDRWRTFIEALAEPFAPLVHRLQSWFNRRPRLVRTLDRIPAVRWQTGLVVTYVWFAAVTLVAAVWAWLAG